jgi:dipeptide/tripeptide permease
VPEKTVVLLGGAVLAAGLAVLAVVTGDPLILAVAAAVAFVAIGHVLPTRRLSLFIARRQPKPLGTARTAFVFSLLGIFLVWASTIALDFPETLLRTAGWISVALFIVAGAVLVAAARCTEDLKRESA